MEKSIKQPSTAVKEREQDQEQMNYASQQSQESKTEFEEAEALLNNKRYDYLNFEPRPLVFQHKYNKRYLI